MKGVILAGGKGTRLDPLTRVTNKHLLPVYDFPVIYYGIEKMVSAGISRIMLVTSPHHLHHFVSLLGSGEHFTSKENGKQVQIVYGIQNEASGVAYGLYIARDYVGDDDCLLYLGDNIFEDDLSEHVRDFKGGATVFLKEVSDPHRFGVAAVDEKGRVVHIEEKPKVPRSNLAVTGVYLYDSTVFDKMVGQPVSERGEKEITYVNNKFLEEGTLSAKLLKKEWFDIGTIDALHHASVHMRKKKHG